MSRFVPLIPVVAIAWIVGVLAWQSFVVLSQPRLMMLPGALAAVTLLYVAWGRRRSAA